MIVVATTFAYFAKLIKQPLIPAYVLTGIVLGPIFGLITNKETIKMLSEIGITFLLFIVGLEINFKKLRNIGLVATLGGTIQIMVLFGLGFIIASVLGFLPLEALYVGIILSFSSTMVVIKLLSDKRELDTLHGRLIVGFLLTEDFFAILALLILPILNEFSVLLLVSSLLKGISLVIAAWLASKYVFPKMFKFAAKSQELLFLMSIAVCFIFAILFSYIGLSIIIGAFIAGVTLANLPYNIQIISKVSSLKDFFATIFFVSLGLELILSSVAKIMVPAVIFFLLILFFKPIITMFLCSFFGYEKRTSFLTSFSLNEISEFSLIIVAQGLLLGQISQEVFSLTVVLAIATIIGTSYFFNFHDKLYSKIASKLEFFDRFPKAEFELESLPKEVKNHVIICGYNRIGYSIVRKLRSLRKKILVVDFNPEVIKKMIRQNIPSIYGDIGDIDLLGRLSIKKAKMIISTVPTEQDNLLLIREARRMNKEILIYVTANHIEEALALYDAGADYVILPHFLGGEHVSLLIDAFTGDLNRIIENKLNHIKELKTRKELGHEHPANNNHRL